MNNPQKVASRAANEKRFLHNGAEIPNLPGVRVEGDSVVFTGYSDADIEDIRGRVSKGKRYKDDAKILQKKYSPGDEVKSAILASLPGATSIDGYGFYEAIAAESLIDRDRDVLRLGFLEILAKRYKEGRSVVDSHSWNHRIGYTFDAYVQDHPTKTGEYQLIVRFYVSPDAKMISGSNAKSEIDAGLVRRLSISYFAPEYKYVSSEADGNVYGRSYWVYDTPMETSESEIEVPEISMVAMGAQPGARIKAEKGGIEKGITFAEKEIKINAMEFTEVKINDKTLKVAPDSVADVAAISIAFDEAKKALAEAEGKLKKYTDQEASALDKLADDYVAVKKLAFPGVEIDTEKEKAVAKIMGAEHIEKEIALLSKMTPKQAEVEKTTDAKEVASFGLIKNLFN